MIYGKTEDILRYIPTEYVQVIELFLSTVSPDMEEKKYELFGHKVYAKVMSYNTPMPETCKIEAHDQYIDIQSTIFGAEGISVFDREKLSEKVPYNEEKDVVLFEYSPDALLARTINKQGYFTMLYPNEAHRPQEYIDGYGTVKKFVIKIHI